MNCIVVDDEPLARQLIESYVERIEGLQLVKSCANALEAFSFMQQKPVDLVFLDIQMPQITGIELLRSLKNKPRVILITAYREYAFEAFDLDVVDYLLKPVSFERFLRAIGKIYQLAQPLLSGVEAATSASTGTLDENYIYFKQDREMVKVYLKDILYIESLRDYVKVKTSHSQIITYQKISYLEQKLPENKFCRVHRSFIIALDKVSSFTQHSVRVGEFEIPIGRNYKNHTLKILNIKNILA